MAKKWSFEGKRKVSEDKHSPPNDKTKDNAEKAKNWEPPPLPQEKPAHGAPAKSNVAGSALHEQVANRNSASPTSWRKPPLPQER